MRLAINPTLEIKVVIRQSLPARQASQTPRMILPHDQTALILRLGLNILAFNTLAAAVAHRAVLLVVVLLAVRLVVDDVEVSVREGLVAGLASEAGFVPAACEAAVGRLDGFAFD